MSYAPRQSGRGGSRLGNYENRSNDNWSDGESSSAPKSFGGGRGGGFSGRGRGRGRGGGFGSRNDGDDERRNNRQANGGGWTDHDDDNSGGWTNRRDNDDDNSGGWTNRRDNDDGGGFSRGRGGAGRGRGRGRGGFGSGNDDDGGGRGGGRGGGARSRDGDWNCPNDNCGHKNFASRSQCQKCDEPKPEGIGGGSGGDDKPRERYIPAEPTENEDEIFGSGISSGINFDKYENIQIKVSGENPVPQAETFEDLGLREFVLNNVRKSGYKKPTPVQKFAIPIVMAGRDLMACAQTGSGKTAAYLVPIINTLLEKPMELVTNDQGVEPQVVVLSPTRELAIQIFNEARKFSMGSMLKVCIAYGGTVSYHQANQLMRGCHILVGTPGRIGDDFVQRGRVSFRSLRFFVLDEADRMLDCGFLPQVEKMLNHESMVPTGDRQTLMFSATFPSEIQRLASQYFSDYLFLAVGIVGGACSDVEQVFYEVPKYEKKDKLVELLKQSGGNELTLVFVETKRTADFVAACLSETKLPTTSIHGDRLQSQRERALADFRSRKYPTLIATSVASRGLDIKGVAHVINYDLPSSVDEYVHRIGRTGRVGNRGKATSFFDPDADGSIASHLVTILKQCGQDVPPFLGSASGFRGGSNSDFGGRDVRSGGAKKSDPTAAQEEEEDW